MIDDDVDDLEDDLNDDDQPDYSEYASNDEPTPEQEGSPYESDYGNINISSFDGRTGYLGDPRSLEEIVSNDGPYEEDTEPIDKPLSQTYGTPEIDAELWHQQEAPDTCAIVSQEYILKSFTGKEFSEAELALEAMEKGYYLPGVGTFPDFVGSLLEDHGIEVERTENNTIEDIKTLLDGNHKIIAAVDAYEIWHPSLEEQLKDILFMPEANHAVMVTGYDDTAQEIILNDPGHPDGREMKIPESDFVDAWADSNNYAVYTTEAARSFKA